MSRGKKDIVLFLAIGPEVYDILLKIAVHENRSRMNLISEAIKDFIEKKKAEYPSLDFPLAVTDIKLRIGRIKNPSLSPELEELLERLNRDFDKDKEAICPLCHGSKEILKQTKRTMGYTLGEGEKTIDEQIIPCPLCSNNKQEEA